MIFFYDIFQLNKFKLNSLKFMFRELSYKTPFDQTESRQAKKTKKMLEDCEKVIKQLQSELQYSLQQNQEKDQIIKLLTQQKYYYQQQSRKNDEQIYPKLKDQLSFNQSLVNGLKQYNKQLTQKNIILEQENKDLWEKCKQKDQILQITQKNIVKLQKEKSKLQKEWSQTLKCVKNKIFEIQQENYNVDQNPRSKQIGKKRASSRGGQKNFNQKQQNRKGSLNHPHTQTNNSKVQQILNEIDKKLLNYEFLDMIQSKELRRQIKNNDKSDSNKQNISDNNPNAFNKNDFKNKKNPILKLSQLNLNQDSI